MNEYETARLAIDRDALGVARDTLAVAKARLAVDKARLAVTRDVLAVARDVLAVAKAILAVAKANRGVTAVNALAAIANLGVTAVIALPAIIWAAIIGAAIWVFGGAAPPNSPPRPGDAPPAPTSAAAKANRGVTAVNALATIAKNLVVTAVIVLPAIIWAVIIGAAIWVSDGAAPPNSPPRPGDAPPAPTSSAAPPSTPAAPAWASRAEWTRAGSAVGVPGVSLGRAAGVFPVAEDGDGNPSVGFGYMGFGYMAESGLLKILDGFHLSQHIRVAPLEPKFLLEPVKGIMLGPIKGIMLGPLVSAGLRSQGNFTESHIWAGPDALWSTAMASLRP